MPITSWHHVDNGTGSLILALVLIFSSCCQTNSEDGATVLDSKNFDVTIGTTEFVFVNFYADWCRFSQILEPIFNDAAKKVRGAFPETSKAVLGKVDCDKQPQIAAKYHISKYPTLKIFRNGEVQKREYRGQRSVDALAKFVTDQLEDPVKEFESLSELDAESNKKRRIIAFFNSKVSPDYDNFKKVASTLRSDCDFLVSQGDASISERPGGQNIVVFKPTKGLPDVLYEGQLSNYDLLFKWAQDKCIPLVREITFENAEELTEEGLPFLMLFHHPDDTKSVEEYNKIVSTELINEKTGVNFLTADGVKFAHPLHHLGKSQKDLPLIAIDSFRHMYLFPKYDDIRVDGRLKQFIADLHSGKLHREFHQGPDPTQTASTEKPAESPDLDDTDGDDDNEKLPAASGPPESTFKKLAPSSNRYTLLRDEL